MQEIYFYLSEGDYNRVKDLNRIEDFTLRHPQLVWSWGTYFRLKQKGFNVSLTYKIPDRGILVMPAIYLAMLQKPPIDVFMICTLADTPPPIYMPMNITQNPVQPSKYPNFSRFPIWHHIPHWPQPGIVPRDESRGIKFENIAFFGHRDQLDPSLLTESFRKKLHELGVNFEIRESNFYNYSDVDATIAIRSFSNEPFVYKPYTKLVNAWMAKTPFLAGRESSFQAIRKSELDFISVRNQEELLQAIQRLKSDVSLREHMVANGLQRMKDYDEDSIIKAWENLLFRDAQQYYKEWKLTNSFNRQLFYLDMFLSRSFRSIKNKVIKQKLFNSF